jgi:hypothetical protein
MAGKMRRQRIRGLALAIAGLLLAATGARDVVFFQGHVNGKVQGFDRIDLAMFRAQPQSSKFYSEQWIQEMQFAEPGIIVAVILQLHNFGFRSGFAGAFMTVSDPAGNFIVDREFTIDPAQVKIDAQGFGLSAGPHRIELVGNEYHVKYRGKLIQGDFTYQPLTGSFQQGDGRQVFQPSGDFLRSNFPIPWARITGTVTYNGRTVKLQGVGSMNHDMLVMTPTRYMIEWRAFYLYSPEATVSIVLGTGPDLNGRWSQRLMVAAPGRILFSSHDYTFQELDPQPVPGAPVPCPRRFRVEAVAGDDWLKGEIQVTRIAETKNVVEDLPYLYGKIASLLVAETWSYRFWCDFHFELRLDGQTRTIAGAGTGTYISSVKTK